MNKHGPGPWKILFFNKPDRLCDAAILDADECTVATLAKWADEYREESKANAEFIANACNAYDDLLAALRGMVEMFEARIHNRPGPCDASYRWDAARAAIAKAEGGEA